MSDTDDKENDLNRSVVEFKAQYNIGVKGRKKGQMQVKDDIFTFIVPLTDQGEVQDYIQTYCIKNNMQLINSDIQPLPGKRHFEFDCKNCGEHSIDMSPANNEFCSNYCQKKTGVFLGK
jgi:hypothetical protein